MLRQAQHERFPHVPTDFFRLIAVPMIFAQTNAGEKELHKNKVPKAVIAAFEKANPNDKGLEFEEEIFEGKTAYEVEYKKDGKEYEFL
jgi:hypothetical protein